MKISELILKMIDYSEGNLHDINHFMKVYSYAKTIGEAENLNENTQRILEAAAVIHDIACPLCREKYGNTNGKYQEAEGEILADEFLKDSGFSKELIERVVYLVGHHHTLTEIKGLDYQILMEADFLVNADENKCEKETIKYIYDNVFVTNTGKRLLETMYLASYFE